MCFQFQSALLDLIQLHTPVGKVARWSSMQGHMLQLSGLEGGGRCGSFDGGWILSPGSWLPGSDWSPVQMLCFIQMLCLRNSTTSQGRDLSHDVPTDQCKPCISNNGSTLLTSSTLSLLQNLFLCTDLCYAVCKILKVARKWQGGRGRG